MEKTKIKSIEELQALSRQAKTKKAQSKIVALYRVLKKYEDNKYVTKAMKSELYSLGLEYKSLYLSNKENRALELCSKDMDIINDEVFRIGIGRVTKYDTCWLEMKII